MRRLRHRTKMLLKPATHTNVSFALPAPKLLFQQLGCAASEVPSTANILQNHMKAFGKQIEELLSIYHVLWLLIVSEPIGLCILYKPLSADTGEQWLSLWPGVWRGLSNVGTGFWKAKACDGYSQHAGLRLGGSMWVVHPWAGPSHHAFLAFRNWEFPCTKWVVPHKQEHAAFSLCPGCKWKEKNQDFLELCISLML